MQASKIVDTVVNYGAAEQHINLSADFERFINRTYGKQDILSISAEKVVKDYNLKGIVFGNYVTQEERYHFVFKISKQLEALSIAAGTNDLGKSTLIIAFGAEGSPRSLAHFNPKKQLINLNRGRKGTYTNVLMGENSFIHEFAHFIDFKQGVKDKYCKHFFATHNLDSGNKTTVLYSDIVNKVLSYQHYMDILEKRQNASYLLSKHEIFARLVESSFTYYVNKIKALKKYAVYFDERKYTKPIYLKKKEILKNKLDSEVVKIFKTLK